MTDLATFKTIKDKLTEFDTLFDEIEGAPDLALLRGLIEQIITHLSPLDKEKGADDPFFALLHSFIKPQEKIVPIDLLREVNVCIYKLNAFCTAGISEDDTIKKFLNYLNADVQIQTNALITRSNTFSSQVVEELYNMVNEQQNVTEANNAIVEKILAQLQNEWKLFKQEMPKATIEKPDWMLNRLAKKFAALDLTPQRFFDKKQIYSSLQSLCKKHFPQKPTLDRNDPNLKRRLDITADILHHSQALEDFGPIARAVSQDIEIKFNFKRLIRPTVSAPVSPTVKPKPQPILKSLSARAATEEDPRAGGVPRLVKFLP